MDLILHRIDLIRHFLGLLCATIFVFLHFVFKKKKPAQVFGVCGFLLFLSQGPLKTYSVFTMTPESVDDYLFAAWIIVLDLVLLWLLIWVFIWEPLKWTAGKERSRQYMDWVRMKTLKRKDTIQSQKRRI